ncbi:MAG: glycosyltransferase [Christensenellales bacterium]|jgi:glycosyltransferase involved in cell wall biosynthesis
MITISVCMIVKNEEAVLARCLDSAKVFADEIIIVDTGSTDQTKQIARQFTEHIYDFEWIDDFAAARNYSFSKASMDYCMWLDADDVVPHSEQQKLLALKESLPSDTDMVMLKHNTTFDEAGNPTFSYYRERIMRNRAGFLWLGAIHEVIPPRGKIHYDDIAIHHMKVGPGDPDRNLRIFEKLISSGVTLDARQQFYYARELYYHQRYDEAIDIFKTFLDNTHGWVENKIDACRILSQCHLSLQQYEASFEALLKSFRYDVPRAETCCNLGAFFQLRRQYEQAIFWYKQALACTRNDRSGSFIIEDCYGYHPHLQLCLCYDALGDYHQANKHNELANICKPNMPAYTHNKNYFAAKCTQ